MADLTRLRRCGEPAPGAQRLSLPPFYVREVAEQSKAASCKLALGNQLLGANPSPPISPESALGCAGRCRVAARRSWLTARATLVAGAPLPASS